MSSTKVTATKANGKRRKDYWDLIGLPDREQLDNDIRGDFPDEFLGRKYGATPRAIKQYREFMNKNTNLAITEQNIERGTYVLDNIENVMLKLERMLESCDQWLRDPDNPKFYELGPRSYEVEVTYEVPSQKPSNKGDMVRKKALLSELLDQTGKDVVEVRYKVSDPRKILTTVADSMEKQLRLLAQIQGTIKDASNEVTLYVLTKIQQVVLTETKDQPELRQRLANAFERIQSSS